MLKFLRIIKTKLKKPKNLGGDIRRVFAITYSIHNKIASRYQWYDRWHQKSYTHKVHYAILSVYVVAVFVGLFTLIFQPVQKPVKPSAELMTLVAEDTSGFLNPKSGEKELIEERTENFKKFEKTENGKTVYRVAGEIGPIHYKLDDSDPNEPYKEINLSIRRGSGEEGDFYMSDNSFQTKFWNKRQQGGTEVDYIGRFQRQGHWIEIAPVALYYENNLGECQEISQVIGGIEPEIDNSHYFITWQNAFGEGIDFRYDLRPDHFFKTVVIRQPSSLPELTINNSQVKIKVVLTVMWDKDLSADDVQINSFYDADKISLLDKSDIADNKNGKEKKFKIKSKKEKAYNFAYKLNDKELWWIQEPIAWDSSSEPQIFNLSQDFVRLEEAITVEISLDKSDLERSQYPLYIDTAISEEKIGASSDDAYDNGTTLYLTDSNIYCNYSTNIRNCGFRFTDIPIPQGATISSATIVPRTYSTSYDDPDLVIYGENVDDSATFVSNSDRPGVRTRTTASVSWVATGIGAGYQSSPDIGSIVQEIVNRSGWGYNNDLTILTVSNQVSGRSYRIYTYNQGASYAPKFNATYTTIKVQGVCKQYNRSDNCSDGRTVKVAFNGVLQAATGTTSSGVWSINSLTEPTSGTTVTVFLDNVDDANEAVAVTEYNVTGNIENVLLYERHLTIGSSNSVTVTNTDLAQYDASVSADEDIFFDVDSGGNLTLPANSSYSDQYLYVGSGNTYQPNSSGSVTCTVPNLEIADSAVFSAGANYLELISSATPLIKTGSFVYGTSTVEYSASSSVNVAGGDYYNLIFNNENGNYSLTADINVWNVLNLNAGVLNAGNYSISLFGSGTPLVVSGTFNYDTSSVKYFAEEATTIINLPYYNLELGRYGYKRSVTVSNSTGGELTDFQVPIVLSSANYDFSKSASDGCDLRIKDSDDTTPLSFWIESWDQSSQSAKVWVKIPSIPNGGKTIYLYYGNTSLPALSDGLTTFPFFDDFTDLSNWTLEGREISVTNGVAILDNVAGSQPIIYRNFSMAAPYIAEVKYQRPSYYRNRLYLTSATGSSSPTGFDYGDFSPSLYWNGFSSTTLSNNTWYIVRWERLASDYNWKIYDLNDNLIFSRTHTPLSTTLARFYFTGSESVSSDLKFDWLRIRKYASPEPTATLGSESNVETTYTLEEDLEVKNNLTISGGTFNQGNQTIDCINFTQSTGSFSGGSVNFTVSGDFSVSFGDFTSTSATLAVGGNWSFIGGSFNHNSGTVDFTGDSGTQTMVHNGDSFNNLNHSGAGTLQLVANGTLSYSKQLTISKSVVANTDQSNFPLLVHLASDSDLASHACSNGNDIYFADAGSNKLSHEIEKYDSETGELIAWVKIPTLSASEDTVLTLHYGDTNCLDQQDKNGVWDNNYKFVQHLSEVSGTHYDSTSNGNNASVYNGAIQGTTGKIGGADYFDGVDDYLASSNSIPISGAASRTLEFWTYADSLGSGHHLIGWGDQLVDNAVLKVLIILTSGPEPEEQNWYWYLWGRGAGNDWDTGVIVEADRWLHHTITYNGIWAEWFIDGESIGTFFHTYNTTQQL